MDKREHKQSLPQIMLEGITIQNFKAFKERQTIPIRPLTLIFGKNSAGKSSIIHALAFLQYAFENGGACDPSSVRVGWETFNFGGWSNLVNDHNTGETIRIGLRFTNCAAEWSFTQNSNRPILDGFKAIVNNESTSGENVESIKWENGRLFISPTHRSIKSAMQSVWNFLCTGRSWDNPKGEVFNPEIIGREKFSEIFTDYIGKNPPLINNARFIPTYQPDDAADEFVGRSSQFSFSEIRTQRVNVIENLKRGLNHTDVLNSFFNELDWHALIESKSLRELNDECANLFRNRLHLGPTRTSPEREIDISLPPNEPWRIVLENEFVRNSVNSSLRELEIPYTLDVSWKKAIHFKPGISTDSIDSMLLDPANIERTQTEKLLSFVTDGGVSLTHRDLGHGVSTTLPILVAIHTASGNCISIEQPELHVHPGLQTVLGDLFIKASLSSSDEDDFDYENDIYHDPGDNNLFIIETHSEHLILRILRRIRETTEGEKDDWPETLRDSCPNGIRPEDVAVLYVNPGEDGARVEPLRINELGEFVDEWPGGFFDERIREIL